MNMADNCTSPMYNWFIFYRFYAEITVKFGDIPRIKVSQYYLPYNFLKIFSEISNSNIFASLHFP